jgi:flavorubredoxin
MTDVAEIADGIYRISTFVPEVGPTGFTFNQFLVDADEPLLFHTGLHQMFPVVADAIATVMPVTRLRWITFGHFEADECGAMNELLAAAPDAQVAHGALGCMVSIDDIADRAPRPLGPDEVLDLGGKRVRNLDTPHVPHGWDAHALFEETTGTMFCGDLMSQVGPGPAITSDDPLEAAAFAEDLFGATCLTPQTSRSIRGLAELAPQRLAIMHGSSYEGDGRAALHALADEYDRRLAASAASAASAGADTSA